MYTLVLVIHVIVSLVLMVVVLLQSSKGGGLAGAFGGAGGAPQQILGTRGMTTLLHKVTIYCGAAFFVTSFLLFTLAGGRSEGTTRSVVSDAANRGELPAATSTMPESATDVFALPDASSETESQTSTTEATTAPPDEPASQPESEKGSGSGGGRP